MIIKLIGQAGQYWENAERLMLLRREDSVDEMKEKLRQKYISSSFSQRYWTNGKSQLRKTSSHRLHHEIDEYLNQCSAIRLESPE